MLFDLRHPTVDDGASLWRLARDSKVLDLNSSYAYLLLSRQFSKTSVLALLENRPAGFATAWLTPDDPNTLFLWQVAVSESARGQGLALRMMKWLLSRESTTGVRFFETTVTPSNRPSTALFTALARDLGAELTISPYFRKEHFPSEGDHEAENLFRIGPLQPIVS